MTRTRARFVLLALVVCSQAPLHAQDSDPVEDAISALLAARSDEEREAAANRLVCLGASARQPALDAFLSAPPGGSRRFLVRVVAELADESVVDALAREAYSYWEGLEFLGEIARPFPLDPVWIGGTDPWRGGLYERAIAAGGGPAAFEFFLEGIRASPDRSWESDGYKLALSDPERARETFENLAKGSEDERRAAARGLGVLGDPRSLSVVEKLHAEGVVPDPTFATLTWLDRPGLVEEALGRAPRGSSEWLGWDYLARHASDEDLARLPDDVAPPARFLRRRPLARFLDPLRSKAREGPRKCPEDLRSPFAYYDPDGGWDEAVRMLAACGDPVWDEIRRGLPERLDRATTAEEIDPFLRLLPRDESGWLLPDYPDVRDLLCDAAARILEARKGKPDFPTGDDVDLARELIVLQLGQEGVVLIGEVQTVLKRRDRIGDDPGILARATFATLGKDELLRIAPLLPAYLDNPLSKISELDAWQLAQVLAAIPDPRALDSLRPMLAESKHRVVAARVLAAAGLSVEMDAIEKDLGAEEGERRSSALLVLAELGSPAAARRALDAIVADPDPAVRAAAARVLSRGEIDGARQALERGAADVHRNVREEAVLGLGRLGDPAALPAVVKAGDDLFLDVRLASRVSRLRLGDTQAVRDLPDLLRRRIGQEYETGCNFSYCPLHDPANRLGRELAFDWVASVLRDGPEELWPACEAVFDLARGATALEGRALQFTVGADAEEIPIVPVHTATRRENHLEWWASVLARGR